MTTVTLNLPTPTVPQGIEASHDPYFVQKVPVGTDLAHLSRLDVFSSLCKGRRVLHVGCTDWPITDPTTSLHVALEAQCARLDGFDVHPEAFESLRPHVRGDFFSDWADVKGSYDLLLVPEVIEHVGDVEGFLKQLDAVDAPHIVLTAPDAYQCFKRHFEYQGDAGVFLEVVHPDHNCWYTAYTLTNVIRKYTDWTVDGVWFFNNISLLTILSKPSKGIAAAAG